MPVPTTLVGFSDLQTEFGGTNPISLGEYYRNAAGQYTKFVDGIVDSGNVIKLGDFKGKYKPSTTVRRVPPEALNAETDTISGAAYGNGTHVCSYSYTYDPTYNFAHRSFNRVATGWGSGWSCMGRYNQTTGVHSGTTTTTVDGVAQKGEWLKIKFPYRFCLTRYGFTPADDWLPYRYTDRMPNTWVIAGSDDNVTWSLVDEVSGQEYSSVNTVYFNTTNYKHYTWYLLIVKVCGNAGRSFRGGADLTEWEMFGYIY